MRPLGRALSVSLALQRGALACALLLFLLPVAWLFSTAYKPARDVFSHPPTLAFTPTLDNFRTIAGYFDLLQLLRSSLTIAVGSTALALLLGVPAGYALARSGWRWAPALVYLFLGVRMVPPVATLIPFYVLMRDVGLLGTVWAVILVHATLSVSFVVWMMFAYFRSLPRELEEAALVDGCTPLGALLRIVLPLVRPGLVASALLCLMLSWNDFLYAAFLDPLRHQDALGGAALGLRHQGHHLGHDGRARPLLDPADPAPGAAAQPLLRPGADARRALSPVARDCPTSTTARRRARAPSR